MESKGQYDGMHALCSASSGGEEKGRETGPYQNEPLPDMDLVLKEIVEKSASDEARAIAAGALFIGGILSDTFGELVSDGFSFDDDPKPASPRGALRVAVLERTRYADLKDTE